MPTIRILLYTDYEEINENTNLYSWGLSELKKLIEHKTRGVAETEITLINRHLKKQPLTHKLLCRFDVLFIFGFLTDREKPYELSTDEIIVLKEWMDRGGGLLMSIDHAAGACKDPDHRNYFTHGRSLGEPIVRAGKMFCWQGPPTACGGGRLDLRDNFNTCGNAAPEKLDDIDCQSDATAQELDLPDPLHRLFWWQLDGSENMKPIERFPDHPHEGKLLIPDTTPNDEWPANSPPVVIAANGTDKRFRDAPRTYKLVAAFDGHQAAIGRIVADSSFHHYLNINLIGIPGRDSAGLPIPNSDLDQIAQYYGNLALWLTPASLRTEIGLDLLFRVATHPDVFEVRGSDIQTLNNVANYALRLVVGISNVHRLFKYDRGGDKQSPLDELLGVIYLGKSATTRLDEHEQEVLFGSIVQAHHDFILESGAVTPYWLKYKPTPQLMIGNGLRLAAQASPEIESKVERLYLLAFQ